MRQPLRLLLLRPEDDCQDQVLRDGPEAGVQEVLRPLPAGAQAQVEKVPRERGGPGPEAGGRIDPHQLMCRGVLRPMSPNYPDSTQN